MNIEAEIWNIGLNETGGLLLGEINMPDFFATGTTGPGQGASHSLTSVKIDLNFVYMVKKMNAMLGGSTIGFWHSHPTEDTTLSRDDINILKQEKLMLVVGCKLDTISGVFRPKIYDAYIFDNKSGIHKINVVL